MLINGVHMGLDDFDAVMTALIKLPREVAWNERTMKFEQVSHTSVEALTANSRGIEAFNDGVKASDATKFGVALQAFNTAAKQSVKDGNSPAQALNISNAAHAMLKIGASKKAVAAFTKAASINKKQGRYNGLYHALGGEYHAMMKLRSEPGANVAAIDEKLKKLRKKVTVALHLRNGETLAPDVMRIEQNEIGFSADRKIGTDNVNDCVCVIIRYPVSHKTALAHVDYSTGIRSLQQLFDRMPRGAALEAKLIGACYGDKIHGDEGSMTSRANMDKITRMLEDRGINVLAADILSSSQPRAVVVDPATFKVSEAIPSMRNPDMYVANAMPMFGYLGKDAHVAFDLTQSDERAPHFLDREHLEELKVKTAKTDAELYDYYQKSRPNSEQIPTFIELINQARKSYQNATSHLVSVLDKTCIAKGITLTTDQRASAIDKINDVPLHIGSQANKFNKPLSDLIKEKLFVTRPDGGFSMDIDGLDRVTLSSAPYTVVEKNIAAHKKTLPVRQDMPHGTYH